MTPTNSKNYQNYVGYPCESILKTTAQAGSVSQCRLEISSDYDQEKLFQLLLGSKKIMKTEANVIDLEAYLVKELQRAKTEGSVEEQVIYLVKLGDLYLLKKDWTKAAKILNCALAIFQKNLDHPVFEQFLFCRLEKIEALFLESQAKPTVYKHQDSVINYRSWLKRIRSSLLESHQQELRISKLLGDLTLSYRELLAALILDSQKIIGSPPVKWACIGLGSMARSEMCPYSDIEFAFLIEKETPENLQYFLLLTQLIELKIINLGETKFPIFGERHESPTPDGFCFDIGGNTPYGNRDTYKLIGTPQSLARFQRQEWIEENIIVSNALGSNCLVVGDKGLFEKYQTKKNAILDEKTSLFGQSHRKSFALRLLKGHTAEFSPNLSKEKEELSAFGIKKELYRPFQEIIASLTLFYNLKEINTFVRIDELTLMGIFSTEGANNLKKAIAKVLTLRLEAHLFYCDEKEFLCHPEQDKPLDSHFMYFDEKKLKTLLEIYQVLIPFHQCGEKFLTSQSKQAFNSSPFYDKSSKVQGAAFDKNLQYAKAQEMRQQAVSLNPNDLNALLHLGVIEDKMGNSQDALPRYLKALEIARKKYGENHSDVAACYNNIGMAYEKLGDYNKAGEFVQKSLEINLFLFGENDPSVAASYNNMGEFYKNLGDYEKALGLYKKAIQILQMFSDKKDENIGRSYNNIGLCLHNLWRYEEALIYYQKALDILLDILGESHPEVATIYNNAGYVYNRLGKYDEALKYHQKALQIRLHILGEFHIDVATSYDHIAGVYSNLGNHGEALEQYLIALKIFEKRGDNHPNTAECYNNIGVLYASMDKSDKALAFYQKGLEMHLKNLGENHPNVARIYKNMGVVYDNLNKFVQALEFYEKCLKIRLSVLGEMHPDVAVINNCIGNSYARLEDYKNAVEFYDKALKIRLQVLSKNHPDIAASFNNMGDIYLNLGLPDEAIEFYKEELKISLFNLGENHLDVARRFKDIGLIYLNLEQYTSALPFFQKALEIRLLGLGENHEDVAASYNNISYVYRYLREPGKALGYYQKVLKIRLQKFPENHHEVATCYNNIGNTYGEIGQHEQAIGYYQKALRAYLETYKQPHTYIDTSLKNIIFSAQKGSQSELKALYEIYTLCVEKLGKEHTLVKELHHLVEKIH